MLKKIFLSFLVCFLCALGVFAQTDTCNLKLKFFEYGQIPENKEVSDLSVSIENLKSKISDNVQLESDSITYRNYGNSKYKVKILKDGFHKRTKKFELDCQFADTKKDNTFLVHIYLKRKGVKLSDQIPSETKQTVNSKGKGILKASIKVRTTIDIDGNVFSAKTKDKTNYAEKAIKSVRLMKFSPIIISGKPKEITGKIIFNFYNEKNFR